MKEGHFMTKKMKRLIASLLAASVSLSCVGCAQVNHQMYDEIELDFENTISVEDLSFESISVPKLDLEFEVDTIAPIELLDDKTTVASSYEKQAFLSDSMNDQQKFSGFLSAEKPALSYEIKDVSGVLPAVDYHAGLPGLGLTYKMARSASGTVYVPGTNIIGSLVGGTLTLRGSGTVPAIAFNSFKDSIHTLIVQENVNIGFASFEGMDKLRSVSIVGATSFIGDYAFNYCTALESVTLSSTVTTIGEQAFSQCPALKSITVPSGVVSIGPRAFGLCTSLETVSLPEILKEIGEAAFAYCSSLQSVALPAGVTAIETGTFAECTALTTFTIPETIHTIGDSAFYGCTSLSELTWLGGVELGRFVFEGCSSLTDISMPNTVTKTGGDTFAECTNLQTVTLSESLEYINDADFYNCDALTEIVIPESVQIIGMGAFYSCDHLRSISFPEHYVDVGAYAFSFCNEAETIEETVKLGDIGDQAFYGTRILKHIEFDPETTVIYGAAFDNNYSLESIDFNHATIFAGEAAFYGCEKLETITDAPILNYVGNGAFYYCKAVETVQLSPDCEVVGEYAFMGCVNLKEIDFADSAAPIKKGAFYDCTALEELKLSANCTELGVGAFSRCTSLETADLSGVAIALDTQTFDGCNSLQEITGVQNITALGDRCFLDCWKLSDITGFTAVKSLGVSTFGECHSIKTGFIPEGITIIPKGVYGNCKAMETITIPEGVTEIDEYAFFGCASLKTIALPDSMTVTRKAAFAFCEELATITGGENVTTVGYSSFQDCPKLESISLSSNLETVEPYAFMDCKLLQDVSWLKNVCTIGESAFYYCESIPSVLLGTQLQDLGAFAFYGCSKLEQAEIEGDITVLKEAVFDLCSALTVVSLPDTLERIEGFVFYDCTSLSGIHLPESLISMGDAVFYQCKSLGEIIIPDSVTEIGRSCFLGCESLTSVLLPTELTEIPLGLFSDCTSLTEVEMPDAVTAIGYGAFYLCENLEWIALPESLTRIDEQAFYHCDKLNEISIPGNVSTIGLGAFAYCGALERINIPRRVTAISDYAFIECGSLSEVNCLGDITYVGIGAFYNCGTLDGVYFHGVAPVAIGDEAFGQTNSSLTLYGSEFDRNWTTPEWTGPDQIPYRTASIAPDVQGECGASVQWEYYANSGTLMISGDGPMDDYQREKDVPWSNYVSNLTSVYIDDGVTYVGDRIFASCNMLRSVYMADSVVSCGQYSFAKCTNLAYVDLSAGLDQVGDYVFYNCKSLDNIILPVGLEAIGDYAFFGCSAIETVHIPDSVSSLGEGAFYECDGIKRAVLSSGITRIEDYTFSGCSALTDVVLSDRTVGIGKFAFANCGALASVYVMAQDVQISDYAFAGCSNLAGLYFSQNEPASLGYRALSKTAENLTAYYTDANVWTAEQLSAKDGKSVSCVAATPASSGSCGEKLSWQYYSNGLLMISGSGAITDYTEDTLPWAAHTGNLRYVVIGNGISSIGANSFAGCDRLEKVILPDSVMEIGAGAFSDCENLRYVDLPDGLTVIGESSFYHCSGLSNVELPGNVETVSDYAFAMCTGLTGIGLAEGLETVGYAAFYGCENLDNVVLPESVTKIGDWVFARCSSLAQITMCNGITEIGTGALFGCESITSIEIPENLQEIPAYMLAGTFVSEIILPDQVDTIGERAFWGCTNLSQIDLNKVSEIHEAAFYESGLQSVLIAEEVQQIGDYAFGMCSDLNSITVDESNGFYCDDSGVLYSKDMTELLQYPAAMGENSYTIPEGSQVIGTGAFYGSSLKEILIPSSVVSVEEAAFALCGNLSSIVLPAELTDVSTAVFAQCSKLSEVEFAGNAPETIGEDAFWGASEELVLLYGEEAQGWTEDQWTGPDGNVYRTCIKREQVYTLAASELTYAEDLQSAVFTVDAANETDEAVEAVMYAAVYEGLKLIAVAEKTVTMDAMGSYSAEIRLSGPLAAGASVKVFLFDAETLFPLVENTVFTLESEITGEETADVEIGDIISIAGDIPTAWALERNAESAEGSGATFEGINEVSVTLTFGSDQMDQLLNNVEKGKIGGVDLEIVTEYMDVFASDNCTTNINAALMDQRLGFVLTGKESTEDQITASEGRSWMPYTFAQWQMSAKIRNLTDREDGAHTGLNLALSDTLKGTVELRSDSERIFSLRETGYAALEDSSYGEYRADGTYVMTVPYGGNNVVVEIAVSSLVQAIVGSENFRTLTADTADQVQKFNVSLCVLEEGAQETLWKLLVTTEGAERTVTDAKVVERAQVKDTATDKTYNPLDYDESVEASEDMVLAVNSISPSKGANGLVTVKLDSTLMEAGAKVYLVQGDTVIEAVEQYYFDHGKLYATFDLTDAEDGVYDVKVIQKEKTAVLQQCFTVDGSLPKGKLTATVNVDKKAKKGTEYKGSITFVNTGYTDVYAPVILIDCGNIELKAEGGEYYHQEVVFVPNREGLAGIVANGETAAYNFDYKVTGSSFVVNVYNYAELDVNVGDEVKLTADSEAADILNYNIQELTGVSAREYAASIAKMACVQASLGEEYEDVAYLRNAYLVNAQGLLSGGAMVSSVDLASRELTLERYYSSDVTLRQEEGLWGKGWYSSFDITAQFNASTQETDNSNIVIKSGSGVSIYGLKDGVYTEAIYGLSTAEKTDSGITVRNQDGSYMTFNSAGKLEKSVDVYGNYVELKYDENNLLTEVASSYGDSLLFSYSEGKLSSVTSSVTGRSVEYTYHNGLLQVVSNDFGAVAYEYDTVSIGGKRYALTKMTSATGAYQSFEYDDLGRVVRISNAEGAVSYDYSSVGSIFVTDVVGNTARMYYDAGGNAKRSIDAAGNMSETELANNLLSSGTSFGLFAKVGYSYDDSHNLTSITDPSGGVVSYDYDDKGNITKVTDQSGKATSYNLNQLGDLQELVYADGKFESFEYDEKGNITAAVKRDGTRVEYAYDELAQLKTVRYSTGEQIKYDYDAMGNITQIEENGAVTTMQYNSRGELTSVKYPDGTVLRYSYDPFGNLTEIYVSSNGIGRTYCYEYDAYGRITKSLLGAAVMAEYEYNPDGRLKKESSYNGAYTLYSYEFGLIKSIYNYGTNGDVLSFFEYSYDEYGNISSIQENTGTWYYGYDKLGQLTRATAPDGEVTVYTYDLSGNRTSVVTSEGVENYNSNELNQYTAYGSATRTYDANGNLISQVDESGTTTYVYDYMDRLVMVTEPDGTVTQYAYDAFGNRSGMAVNGEATYYVNTPTGDGHALLSIKDYALESDYIQGIGMVGRVVHDRDTGTLEFHDYSYNHLGSTSEITDESGNVVNSYTYDQEGKVLASVEGLNNPFTYVGKYGITDDGNGLYYARARFISGDTMSFISPDPIGQNGDLNVYRYAQNNPVSKIDITGKYSLDPYVLAGYQSQIMGASQYFSTEEMQQMQKNALYGPTYKDDVVDTGFNVMSWIVPELKLLKAGKYVEFFGGVAKNFLQDKARQEGINYAKAYFADKDKGTETGYAVNVDWSNLLTVEAESFGTLPLVASVSINVFKTNPADNITISHTNNNSAYAWSGTESFYNYYQKNPEQFAGFDVSYSNGILQMAPPQDPFDAMVGYDGMWGLAGLLGSLIMNGIR